MSQKRILPTFCKLLKMSLKLYSFLNSEVTSLAFTDIVGINFLYMA